MLAYNVTLEDMTWDALFEADDVECLMEATNQVRLGVWRQQPARFSKKRCWTRTGHWPKPQCKQGMDVAYDGTWGYHPLSWPTPEPLYLVNRSGNRPSHEGAAVRFDQATHCAGMRGFARSCCAGPRTSARPGIWTDGTTSRWVSYSGLTRWRT